MVFERLLTLKEAANLITLSVGTLYNWRNRGIITNDKKYKESYVLDIREKWLTHKL